MSICSSIGVILAASDVICGLFNMHQLLSVAVLSM